MDDVEKPTKPVIENVTDLHEFNEREGYVITDNTHGELKRARDGTTILLPQPSEDPHDPLNWSCTRKHLILIIISMKAQESVRLSAAGFDHMAPKWATHLPSMKSGTAI